MISDEDISRYELVLTDDAALCKAAALNAENCDDEHLFLFSGIFPGELRQIYRYQSAELILSEMMAFWEECRKMSASERYGGISELTLQQCENDAEIVYVCGYDGGCGKTTVSVLLAKTASVYFGRKVLVLSTGGLSDLYDHFPSADDRNGMDLGILLMNFVKGKRVSARDHVISDSTGVCCLRRSQLDPDGYDDLSEDEFEAFIDYIKNWKIFDLIVIDVNDRFLKSMIKPDKNRKVVMVRDRRRLLFRTENIWYMRMFSELSPLIVENCAVRREKDPVFISEEDLDVCEKEEIDVYYSPESIYVKDGVICVDLTGSLGQCGTALYRKLFLERSMD